MELKGLFIETGEFSTMQKFIEAVLGAEQKEFISENEVRYSFKGNYLNLLSSETIKNQDNGIKISLNSSCSIEQLEQRLEFFNYSENTKLSLEDFNNYHVIKDLEDRTWVFSCHAQ